MPDQSIEKRTDACFIRHINNRNHSGLTVLMFMLWERRVLKVEPTLPSRFERWLCKPAITNDSVAMNDRIIDRIMHLPEPRWYHSKLKFDRDRWEYLRDAMHEANHDRGDDPYTRDETIAGFPLASIRDGLLGALAAGVGGSQS